MILKLYKNKTPDNTLEKNIEFITDVSTLGIYDSIDITNPTFVLNYNEKIFNCNYLYCPDLNRYYFCNLSVNNEKRFVITCKVDVLMSYKEALKKCSVTVIRSESVGRPTYIPDSSLPLYPSSQYVTSLIIGDYSTSNTTRNFLLSTK